MDSPGIRLPTRSCLSSRIMEKHLVFKIVCKDNFYMSILLHSTHVFHTYSSKDNTGKYNTVEIVLADSIHEELLEPYQNPLSHSHKYCWVPIKLLAKVINKHGGVSYEYRKETYKLMQHLSYKKKKHKYKITTNKK